MDVVYPYRRPWDEFELRFSFRSLVNVKHDRVIVAGDRPRFASDAVIHVAVPRQVDRFRSSTANITAAIEQGGITGKFIVMNDDMFVLKPWRFRREHKGTIAEYLAGGASSGGYRAVVEKTRDVLVALGVSDPLFYGLHTPMVYEAKKLLEVLAEFGESGLLLRTLYGNIYPARSVSRADVKAQKWEGIPPADDVFSTSDGCARHPGFRAWMNARFPNPSPYEAAGLRRAA